MAIETEADSAIIKVIDQGPGISSEDLPLIFDKFQQTHTKPELNIKGTGLGLAIVKNIVEAHGGKVGVTSELNTGSTFWIAIPRFIDNEDAAE
jgi:signal transduction histidine kinase